MRAQAAHHAGVLEAAAALDLGERYAGVEPPGNAGVAQCVGPHVGQGTRIEGAVGRGYGQQAFFCQAARQMRLADVGQA